MQVDYPAYFSTFPLIKKALDYLTYPTRLQGIVALVFSSQDHELLPLKFTADPVEKTGKTEVIHELGTGRVKRRRYSYVENATIARRLDIPEDAENFPTSPFDVSSLENPQLRDAIGDHAYRRVLLFYYLCAAYYNSGCAITRGRTVLQHGKSNYAWSSAAHSSVLPHVCDDFFLRLKEELSDSGLSETNCKILATLGVRQEKILKLGKGPLKELEIIYLFEGIDTENGLLNSQSGFYHNLNSTVELPHTINEYDVVIEGVLRDEALRILNKVSQEEMHPYEGLKEFVAILEEFYKNSEKETTLKLELLREAESLEKRLWAQEKSLSSGSLKSYLNTVQKIGLCYSRVQDLRQYTLPIKLSGRLTWQKNYFSPDTKPSTRNYERIKKLIKSNPFAYQTMDPIVQSLKYTQKLIELEKRTTLLPPLTLLSGKMEQGALAPLSEDELFEQRLCLIRRV